MDIKFYVGKDHFEDAYAVREAVFMKEQGFQNEVDNNDDKATHCVIYDNDLPVAVGRYYNEKGERIIVGRICVLPQYRGKNLGARLLEEIEAHAVEKGYRSAELSAQVAVKEFYEKYEYKQEGKFYLDEHCLHVKMIKKLRVPDKLQLARLKINKIDEQMAKLFCERMKAVKEVVEYKIENHFTILDVARETEVIERNVAYVQNEELKEYYRKYITMQMQISKEYQAQVMDEVKTEE